MRFSLSILFILCSLSLTAQEWLTIDETAQGSRYDDLTFVNNNLGFTVTGNGLIRRTTDGGATWPIVRNGNDYYRAVEFFDESLGFVGGLSGTILRTENGGDTWTDISNQVPTSNTIICGWEHIGNTIWGVGNFGYPAVVIKSTDRGETWTTNDLSSLADGLVEVYFQDEQVGFAAGIKESSGAVILRTDDGGETWNTVFSSGPGIEYVWKLFPVGDNTIYGSIESFAGDATMVRSTDGGLTWTELLILPTFPLDIQGIGFINEQTGWVSPRDQISWITTDGGTTWTQDASMPSNVNRFYQRPDGLLFAAGSSIHYYAEEPIVSSSRNFQPHTPSTRLTAYPNPVAEVLNYSVEIDQATNLRIDLLTLDGRILANLTAGRVQIGTHEYSYILPASIPAGQLLLVLRSDDTFAGVPITRR